jgi:hypothetical protein
MYNFCVPNTPLTIQFINQIYDLHSFCVSQLTSILLFFTGILQNNAWCMKRFANNEKRKEYKYSFYSTSSYYCLYLETEGEIGKNR